MVIVGSGAAAVAMAAALVAARVPVCLLEAGPLVNRVLPEGSEDEPFEGPDGKVLANYGDCHSAFQWFRLRQAGGKMNRWGAHCPRFSDTDFHEGTAIARELEWPVTYAELEPYYARAERILAVSGRADHLIESPDGAFTRAVEATPMDRWLTSAFGAQGIAVTPRRQAHYSVLSHLAALSKDDKFSLIPSARVLRIEVSNEGKPCAVTYFDARRSAETSLRASTVVLAAGAIESAVILLSSTSDIYPTGLGNRSGTLGRNLLDHVCIDTRSVATAQVPVPNGREGFFLPRVSTVPRVPLSGFQRELNIEVIKGQVTVSTVQMGSMAPNAENRVELTGRRTRLGSPIPRIVCAHSPADRALIAQMTETSEELFRAFGTAKVGVNNRYPPGHAIHQVGTCRMGADRRTSMLDGLCRSHEVPGLWVVDGGAFVTLPEKNPTLTIMALATRAGDSLAAELRRR